MSALVLAGSLLIFVCAAIGVASVIVHSRVKWFATEMGRHLMAYMAVMAAILTLSSISVVARWFGAADATWFQVLRFGVFACLPFVMGQRLYLQIKAQRVERRSRR